MHSWVADTGKFTGNLRLNYELFCCCYRNHCCCLLQCSVTFNQKAAVKHTTLQTIGPKTQATSSST